jgi:aspartyl-tRNA(Asn)/glutamyl-tRNA(Gln) amidotransferase subunit B
VAERITTKSARDIYAELRTRTGEAVTAPTVEDIEQMIRERRLEIVRDTGALDAAIAAAMAAKADAVRDFRGGKQNALGPLIGLIMKQVAGADPKQVRERLISAINSGE